MLSSNSDDYASSHTNADGNSAWGYTLVVDIDSSDHEHNANTIS